MIINIRHTSWNWNISRKFYTSIDKFIEERKDDIDKIKDNRAIIYSTSIEVWDLRSNTDIIFESKEYKDAFLKHILNTN